ncbi:tetratricopeptide repeat-containing sensor histidine kinase [Rufibacter psychrotolerans]|uniref:tetratricopeptide repeat-containing sensor histidine kinase n=1 Tax=Rufibacter psychrotolerans TaxID=2812556 RepID=UPI0019689F95|nr:tetratricopeptide repeat-containing sensor histidine kinase [Rufibacter sp. SYSU D00308]
MKRAVCLLLLVAGQVQAQQISIDSLQAQISRTKIDSAKVRLLNLAASKYINTDPVKARTLSLEAEQLASKSDNAKGQAAALNIIGVTYLLTSELGKSLSFHHQALKLRQQLRDTAGIVSSLTNIGNVHVRNNELLKSLHIYAEALKLAEKTGDKKGMARLYNNMGAVYENSNQLPKALVYLQKAAKLKREQKDTLSLAATLSHMGSLSVAMEDHAKGLTFLLQANEVQKRGGNDSDRIITLREIAYAYDALEDYPSAIKYAEESLELAKKMGATLHVGLASGFLHKLYAAKKQYPKAYQSLLVRTHATDTLFAKQRRNLMAEAEVKFEVEKKELENLKLKLEKEKYQQEVQYEKLVKQIAIGVGFSLLALAGLLFIGWRRVKKSNAIVKAINQEIEEKNRDISQKQETLVSQSNVLQTQRDELEKLNTFQKKLFSIVSHDLRSPFTSVQSLFYLADKNAVSDQDFKRLFYQLGKDYDNATNLLNNILVWSKSQMNGGSVKLEKLPLKPLISETIELLQHNATLKGILLLQKETEEVQVLADKERLKFVIRNLISNAIKFTPEAGTIEVSAIVSDQEVQIAVQDNGTGIPLEAQSKLFTEERYSRRGTSNEKGTGIGLMLCKELLDSMNGTISVQSEPKAGSTFLVQLPKAPLEETEKEHALSLALN